MTAVEQRSATLFDESPHTWVVHSSALDPLVAASSSKNLTILRRGRSANEVARIGEAVPSALIAPVHRQESHDLESLGDVVERKVFLKQA